MKISRSPIPTGMEVVTGRVSWCVVVGKPRLRNFLLSHHVQCKKGDTIAQFLEKCRQQFPELRGISVDNLMYIKVLPAFFVDSATYTDLDDQEDLIVPQVGVDTVNLG